MIKNIKVDLVYYTIGTDFEMEFNLCGCCRMRLLTDTVSNRTEFSKSLARAVSRSNIIIACGPVFGEKGLVATVAKITNIGTQTIDNKKYGIEDQSEISILKGSTPLVTSDGMFCGCIIENGPQVIILLTESKSLRKRVMKELVHPYISQWSYLASKNNNATPITHVEIEQSKNESPEFIEKEDSKGEESDFITPDTEFVLDIDEPDEEPVPSGAKDGKNDLFYNVSSFDHSKAVEEQNSKYYLEDFDNASFTEKKEKHGFLIFLIVFMVFIALAIIFLAVIRPLLLGSGILEYLKSAFTPRSATDIFIRG